MADMMMMGMGFMGFLSVATSLVSLVYKDSLCVNYPSLSFLCSTTPAPIVATSAPSVQTPAPTTTAAAATSGGTGGGGSQKRFSPYVLLNTSSIGLIGAKSKWTTLAFVVGYANEKIQWDAGTVDAAKLKARIAWAKKNGGGVIVSFGGQGAGIKGTKYLSELAGKYMDPVKLADAYGAIATTLQSTWLDFDVEGGALKDTAAIDRRNKALAILQKKRPELRISFTVPVGLSGLNAATKSMFTKVKGAGVRIDLVNIMCMYFTKSKAVMSTATLKAVKAATPFITSLGAKIGVTPQIGVNPDKPYTHENFTTTDATKLLTAMKSNGNVMLLSYWSLNNDVAKHKGAFATIFKSYP